MPFLINLSLQIFTLRQFFILSIINIRDMEIINNYKSYKQYLPQYANWRDEQDLARAKRLEYLKQNPDKMNEKDIERGKILLHAIDVMDEYSQANAEDMEVATEFAKVQVVELANFAGMGAGFALLGLKGVKNWIAKASRGNKTTEMIFSMLPSVIGMLVGTAAAFPAIMWATKAKVSASRRGRFEAMNNDLKNPAVFAVLTPEQQEKANELAKDIQLEDRDKKRLKQNSGFNLNPMDSVRTLKKYFKGDEEYKAQKAEFDKTLQESEAKFGSSVDEKQIRSAKRDQQILADMVRRMDVASQDYAENTELATNTMTTLSLGTGGLVGWVSNKLMNAMKISGGKWAKFIPWGIGAAIPLGMAIYAAKAQKLASRIGRYKVKQEMLNNPAELVYVDDKETESMKDVKLPERAKKPNIFKFFVQLLKDNKEYSKYMKTKGEAELKLHKAVEKLELSPEQLRQAKALQNNVFKTFNKVDEKSQTYSESVEAMGEVTKQGVASFGALGAMGVSVYQFAKMLKNPAAMESSIIKTFAKTMMPFAFVLLPVIGIDIYTTKAQKKASRVADMLALNELKDYRHYVDYSAKTSEEKMPAQSNLLERFKA